MATYISNIYNEEIGINVKKIMSLNKFIKIENMTIGNKLFPTPKIIDYISFNNYEINLQNILFDNFIKKDRFMAILVGNPASGKTIFSYQLGMKLLKNTDNSIVYYLDFRTIKKNHIIENINLLNNKKQNIYFIFDNIHFNIDIAFEIYEKFISDNIKILFVSRDKDKNDIEVEDKTNANSILKSSMILHKLKDFNNNEDKVSILEKIKAIITKFKEVNNLGANIGEDEDILEMIGNNLVLLYYYLDYWKTKNSYLSFTSIDKKSFLNNIWNNINIDLQKKSKDLKVFINLAVLYQYEICLIENLDDAYSLYHPNYAKLVIDAYCETREFKNLNQTREEFTISYLKNYFEKNYKYISLKDELLKLDINVEDRLLIKLLDTLDKTIIEDYLLKPNNKTVLKDFIEIFRILISYGQKDFAQKILSKLLENQFNIYSYNFIGLVILYNRATFDKCDNLIIDKFRKFLLTNHNDIKITGFDIFYISKILLRLYKTDKELFEAINNNIQNEELIKIAKNSFNIYYLGNGLNNLTKIDKEKTAKIYKKLDIHFIINLAKNASTFDTLTNGLNNLHHTVKDKTVKIVEALDIDLLINLAKGSSTIHLLSNSLNNLNQINKSKAAKIYKTLDINFLINIAKNTATLDLLTKSLKNLNIIDKSTTADIFEVLDINFLISIARNSSTLEKLCTGLNNINSIDKNLTAMIYKKLDINFLLEVAKNSPTLDVLSNGFYYYNKFDKDITAKVYQMIDEDYLLELIKNSSSIKLLGQGLNDLKKINSNKTATLYKEMDIDTLYRYAQNTFTINTLAYGLYYLNKIDEDTTAKFYKVLDNNHLLELTKNSSNIETLGQGLYNLNKIDKDKTIKIYNELDIKFLINFAKDAPKYVILKEGLSFLKKIDKDKTNSIISAINFK